MKYPLALAALLTVALVSLINIDSQHEVNPFYKWKQDFKLEFQPRKKLTENSFSRKISDNSKNTIQTLSTPIKSQSTSLQHIPTNNSNPFS